MKFISIKLCLDDFPALLFFSGLFEWCCEVVLSTILTECANYKPSLFGVEDDSAVWIAELEEEGSREA